MITLFFTAPQRIALNHLQKWQTYPKNIWFRTCFLHSLMRRSVSPPESRDQCFCAHEQLDVLNEHRAVDELRRLKILRAPHPSYSPDISLCDF
jgi:hypothetical protein